MEKIAIVDPSCLSAYDQAALEQGALGGTEATILRVTGALTPIFHSTIFQNNRTITYRDTDRIYRPIADVRSVRLSDYRAILVINSWKLAVKLRKLSLVTPIYLWLHVFPGWHNHKMGAALARADIDVVCVSHSHASWLARFLKPRNNRLPRISFIYNPVADNLHSANVLRDKNRLLFASSPHKGLSEVYAKFTALRQTIPELRLDVADPGYLRWDVGFAPVGVRLLGTLPHAQLLHQMRQVLCLFYPQSTFAETFGLVIAEANAVGTPALLQHGLGANNEIASSEEQCVNCGDPTLIQARIQRWQKQFPNIVLKPEFRLSQVADRWQQLLEQNNEETRYGKR